MISNKYYYFVLIFLTLLLNACQIKSPNQDENNLKSQAVKNSPKAKMTSMKISSPVFNQNGQIPSQYSCDGANINPPLTIDDIPINSKTLVLVVDDPDAPAGNWTHWLVFNIDPNIREIAENKVPVGAKLGLNSFGETKYGGPCPPSGTHHYIFHLYALDMVLGLTDEAGRQELEIKMAGHILGQGELVGLYKRG
jgi:Raf kinase inhibitor-like YbhB/YbcL family protein